jgi:hypothetical protein
MNRLEEKKPSERQLAWLDDLMGQLGKQWIQVGGKPETLADASSLIAKLQAERDAKAPLDDRTRKAIFASLREHGLDKAAMYAELGIESLKNEARPTSDMGRRCRAWILAKSAPPMPQEPADLPPPPTDDELEAMYCGGRDYLPSAPAERKTAPVARTLDTPPMMPPNPLRSPAQRAKDAPLATARELTHPLVQAVLALFPVASVMAVRNGHSSGTSGSSAA